MDQVQTIEQAKTNIEKDFKDAVSKLQTVTEVMSKVMGSVNPDNIPEILKLFKALHEGSTLVDAIKKVVDSVYDYYATEVIPAAFERNEVDSVHMFGRNFILSGQFFASIKAENKEAAFKWLKDNGLSNLIMPNVNSRQLTSALSSKLEDEGITAPSDIISQHRKKLIVVRKS